MKSPILAAITLGLAVSSAALSFSSVAAPPPGDPETTCDLERSIAANFMSLRQQGVEKDTVVSNMEEQMGGEMDEHSQRIINDAFDEPIAEEDPAQATEDFAQAQHAACVENYAGT